MFALKRARKLIFHVFDFTEEEEKYKKIHDAEKARLKKFRANVSKTLVL